jgi:hypothetical protein
MLFIRILTILGSNVSGRETGSFTEVKEIAGDFWSFEGESDPFKGP